MFRQLCEISDITKVRTTPYRPTTNGMIERFHRTLNSMLAKVIRSDQRDWDIKLPGVMMADRASVHEATRYTPNRLVLRRETRLPVDLMYPTPPTRKKSELLEEYVESLQDELVDTFAIVRRNLAVVAQTRKNRYDLKIRENTTFHQGEKVWYFYPRRLQGKSQKWQSWYTVPYEILRVIDSHTLMIRKGPKARTMVVHRDKVKRYYQPDCDVKSLITSKEDNTVQSTPGDGEVGEPIDSELILPSSRPCRSNKQPPKYLQQFVCRVFRIFDEEMAPRTVQIPSGMPYCFLCNLSFQSDYNLNRHNASYGEKHTVLIQKKNELRKTCTAIREDSQSIRVTSESLNSRQLTDGEVMSMVTRLAKHRYHSSRYAFE